MTLSPITIAICVLATWGFILFVFVRVIVTRRTQTNHRDAIIALRDRVRTLEAERETMNRRTENVRDQSSAIRRDLAAVGRDLRELQTSFAPRALQADEAETPQTPKRRRRRKGEAKSALERVASDDEIIDGGDE